MLHLDKFRENMMNEFAILEKSVSVIDESEFEAMSNDDQKKCFIFEGKYCFRHHENFDEALFDRFLALKSLEMKNDLIKGVTAIRNIILLGLIAIVMFVVLFKV